MKVKESKWHEALKADQKDKPNWSNDAARRNQFSSDQLNAANKNRQSDSPLKDEMKFASVLESTAKPQKNQHQEDSGEERRDDRRKEKKQLAEKDSAEPNVANEEKSEKNESYGGQFGGSGGQDGFGANINHLSLNENFAARSILHIADLERLISTIRTQISLGGRREIILQLKRSVLEGLQVKITTDPAARVQIEFLAASEKMRSQINEHSQELAEILRGRGINLGSLTTSLSAGDEHKNLSEDESKISENGNSLESADLEGENTFAAPPDDDKLYQA